MTLVELTITVALSLLIIFAVLQLLDSGTHTERAQQSRDQAITTARESIERAAKDIRQATAVNPSSTHSSLDIQTLIAGSARRVIFDGAGSDFRRRLCTAFDFAAACGGTPTVVASHLATIDIFCFDYDSATDRCVDSGGPPAAPALTSIRTALAVQPEVFSGGPIRLATEVKLRNL